MRSQKQGFTIVELLVVMGLMLLVVTISLPAFRSMTQGYQLTNAGQVVADELQFARQNALTRNRQVEIRFYSVRDPLIATNIDYRAVQSFLVDETGVNYTPLDRVQYLPSSSIISSDQQWSTLFKLPPLVASPPTVVFPLGVVACQTFRFLGNGSTDLDRDSEWYLTMCLKTAVATTNGPGLNYVTTYIDPVSGQVKTFRP